MKQTPGDSGHITPIINPYLSLLQTLNKEDLDAGEETYISLFCGGGGLDVGVSLAGFRCLFASDIDQACCDTIKANLPHAKVIREDISELTEKRIKTEIGKKDVSLIVGGPPCQSFSILGKRGALKDPRGKLIFEYLRIINEIKPKAFLLENVPGLLSTNDGKDWQQIIKHLGKITGYHFQHATLNSVEYGVPQFRERVFLVGFKNKVKFSFPAPKYKYLDKQKTLVNLPNAFPSKLALENVDGLKNHEIRKHGPRVIARYNKIAPGDRDTTDHTDRINPDKPSGTVLVGSSAGGGRPHIHPLHPRVISVREAARLQSFPDWYVFEGTTTNQYRQIGNAVPVLMAREVARAILKALQDVA